jgi:hypothetical protein
MVWHRSRIASKHLYYCLLFLTRRCISNLGTRMTTFLTISQLLSVILVEQMIRSVLHNYNVYLIFTQSVALSENTDFSFLIVTTVMLHRNLTITVAKTGSLFFICLRTHRIFFNRLILDAF